MDKLAIYKALKERKEDVLISLYQANPIFFIEILKKDLKINEDDLYLSLLIVYNYNDLFKLIVNDSKSITQNDINAYLLIAVKQNNNQAALCLFPLWKTSENNHELFQRLFDETLYAPDNLLLEYVKNIQIPQEQIEICKDKINESVGNINNVKLNRWDIVLNVWIEILDYQTSKNRNDKLTNELVLKSNNKMNKTKV